MKIILPALCRNKQPERISHRRIFSSFSLSLLYFTLLHFNRLLSFSRAFHVIIHISYSLFRWQW